VEETSSSEKCLKVGIASATDFVMGPTCLLNTYCEPVLQIPHKMV
jgi:hypothetical protein